VVYFLVIWVSQFSGISAGRLKDEGFPAVATIIGGHWLGALIAIGGMASCLGIYASVLLSVSRVPMVMAEDKLLPTKLNKKHKRFNTPYISIIVCSIVVSAMVHWDLEALFIIDVTIYGAGLALEYISLIKLRIKEPETYRPFKIPLGVKGLCIVIALPTIIYFIAFTGALSSTKNGVRAALFAFVLLCSAELLWQIVKRRKAFINQQF
jgi:amino acid transporter